MKRRTPYLLMFGVTSLATLLAGCQLTPNNAKMADTATSEPESGTPKIHLQLHAEDNDAESQEAVTLVASGETLQKAIRAAFPEAPIMADGGIRLDQRIDVWADGLTPSRYLEYLGSQVDASIHRTNRGEIEVRSTDQWQITLPQARAAELMPQAVQLANQAQVDALVLGDAKNILLLSGKPSDLDRVRRAMNELSDRITLERNLQGDLTAGGAS